MIKQMNTSRLKDTLALKTPNNVNGASVKQALEASFFLSQGIRWGVCFGFIYFISLSSPPWRVTCPLSVISQDLNEGKFPGMRERGVVFLESFSVPSSCQVLSSHGVLWDENVLNSCWAAQDHTALFWLSHASSVLLCQCPPSPPVLLGASGRGIDQLSLD